MRQHLHAKLWSEWRQLRSRHVALWQTPLVHGSLKSLDRLLVDFCLLPDIRFQQPVLDNIVDVDHGLPDTLVQKFALASVAHLQDHVDAR